MASDHPFIGRRLGSYQIEELIGRGGMGEVYRARDTRLGRDVAIKILTRAFSQEPERLARFEREARLLAALNHPHIGAIYGVEEAPSQGPGQTSTPALVLELVDGETLAARISRGSLPVADALTFARQIADALDAAHEKGIVHRDLKPANIIITGAGAVKVLDFGLAKDASGDDVPSNLSHAPTVTVDGTRAGVILGTAAYMSPEQARGKAVDKRTDIWAFGCVLYEMLSGQPAYGGKTLTDTLAAIIEREPRWDALSGSTPRRIRDLLRRCLQKDPTTRLRDIGDARTEIDEALAHRTRRRVPFLWRVAGVSGGLLLLLAAGALWWKSPERQVQADPSEWEQITSFPDSATQPALSPDGRILTFIRGPGTFESLGQIYVKLLPNGEAVPLTSDDLTKMGPVFSPDGSRIAYTVNSEADPWSTWVVPTLRGKPARWLRNASGLTWIGPGDLLFSEIRPGTVDHMGIVTSPESRATSRTVYFPAREDGMAHRSALSPDGTSVLLVEMTAANWVPCRLVPLAGDSEGKIVGPPDARCTGVAWSPDGKLMYFSADRGDGFHLWRQRFPDGQPEQITFGPSSQDGAAIAPDGRSLITSVGFRQRGVWIHDASGDRQISGEGYAYYPLFSRDGKTICYRRSSTVAMGLTPTELWKMDLSSGQTERLLPGQLITSYDVARDDERIVAAVVEADGKSRLWLAWLDGREPPRPIPDAEGDSPRFGAPGEIFFRAADGNAYVPVRIDANGGGRRKVSARSISTVVGMGSPDGRWFAAVTNVDSRAIMSAFSTSDDVVVPIGPGAAVSRLRWSPEGRRAALSIQLGEASAYATGRTYVLPLSQGSMLPPVPKGGFRSEAELAAIPGVEVLPYGDVALAPSSGVYVFSRETVTRNLYRIPLR